MCLPYWLRYQYDSSESECHFILLTNTDVSNQSYKISIRWFIPNLWAGWVMKGFLCGNQSLEMERHIYFANAQACIITKTYHQTKQIKPNNGPRSKGSWCIVWKLKQLFKWFVSYKMRKKKADASVPMY